MPDPSPATPIRVAVAVNPERTDVSAEVLQRLSDAGDAVAVHELDVASADALAASVRAAAADVDVVAAIGGDGTQRTAAGALRGTSAALAVVPGGTVNLLAHVLGVGTVEQAVAAITGGRRHPLDLGLLDGDPFVLNASTGFDATVMSRVDDQAKRLGKVGYFLTGLRALRDDHPRPVEVLVDGQPVYSGRAMTVMVANVGQRGSADFTLIPDARPDDGRIDVLVQRSDELASMARAVVALARGQRPAARDAITAQGASVEVRWSRPVWVQRDGDARGRARVTRYGVEAAAVQVCVPAGAGGAFP